MSEDCWVVGTCIEWIKHWEPDRRIQSYKLRDTLVKSDPSPTVASDP